jgi:hypothetical protein
MGNLRIVGPQGMPRCRYQIPTGKEMTFPGVSSPYVSELVDIAGVKRPAFYFEIYNDYRRFLKFVRF